jgi:hypothetical protein
MGLSKNKTNLTSENSPKLEKEELPSEKEELSSKEDNLKKPEDNTRYGDWVKNGRTIDF